MKLIKNAFTTGSAFPVDILYDDKIRRIEKELPVEKVDEVLDLEGKLLIPGCIDAHVHFNDPGFNHREDFLSGTTAAACGGITTIVDMPCTSLPPATSVENLIEKISCIDEKAVVDYALWGGISGNDLPLKTRSINDLWSEGVVGFKIYTISGMPTFTDLTYMKIGNILSEFPQFLFAFHAEDKNIINHILVNSTKNQLRKSDYYARTRPVEAEFKAVETILDLAVNNKIHFVHISSRVAAQLIIARKEIQDVTFETCPHYLQFTSSDIPVLLGRIKTAPPVKEKEDRSFLREALISEKIDYVATDHAGCDYAREKTDPDFSRVYNGIPGTELMVPYLFSEFYQTGKVSLEKMIEITSENQAKRLGLYPEKGSLEIGTDADFTIIDLKNSFIVDENLLHSRGRYSPWHGERFACRVAMSVIRGVKVFDKDLGLLAKPGFGKWIRRQPDHSGRINSS